MMKMEDNSMRKILVINLGSTSTKVAFYENEECLATENINHPASELKDFKDFWEQDDYRTELIEDFLVKHKINPQSLDAIVSRGGHTQALESGVYRIDELMLEQQASGQWGKHPCDLGSKIAYRMAQKIQAIPLIVDPPISDEFSDLARVSGHPLFERRSSFHALSHKATAKRFARENDLNYEDLNLIVVHLGGGISVAPHQKGRMIDGDNSLDGDGAFSTNRAGALPVGEVIRMCYSGEYTYEEAIKMINGNGGMMAYMETADIRDVEQAAQVDEKARLYLDAMIYQVSKQIGAMATVLNGKVDAILITGGIAHSKTIIQDIINRVQFIAPIMVYPGENEMESLARGALEGLLGETQVVDFSAKVNDQTLISTT